MFNLTTHNNEFLFCFSQTLKELANTKQQTSAKPLTTQDSSTHQEINKKTLNPLTPTNHLKRLPMAAFLIKLSNH